MALRRPRNLEILPKADAKPRPPPADRVRKDSAQEEEEEDEMSALDAISVVTVIVGILIIALCNVRKWL